LGEVVELLEQNLIGPAHEHERMVMRGIFVGKKWRIDHCVSHWELVIDRRYTMRLWFTEVFIEVHIINGNEIKKYISKLERKNDF